MVFTAQRLGDQKENEDKRRKRLRPEPWGCARVRDSGVRKELIEEMVKEGE